jgi:hypothetical protein
VQKSALTVIGQVVNKGIEEWFEGLVNHCVFARIMECARIASFEIKVGVAKIFGCGFDRSPEHFAKHLIDVGALGLMIEVLDAGTIMDYRLHAEFFGVFARLWERFPALHSEIETELLSGHSFEVLSQFEADDESGAAAHRAFMSLILPAEAS